MNIWIEKRMFPQVQSYPVHRDFYDRYFTGPHT